MTMTDKGTSPPRERILEILNPFETAAFVDAIGLERWDALAGARTILDCREILKGIGAKEIRDMVDFGVPVAKLVHIGS